MPPTGEDARYSVLSQSKWFDEEVKPHEPALRGYLRNRYPALDTDDLVQESYLRLLKIRADGRIASSKAYVFAIARNTAHRLFRRGRLFSPVSVNELPASCLLDESGNAADATNTHQRLELAVAAIASLPARCQEVVRLVALEGRSYGEVADQLAVSEATVRVQMARGIARCMQFVREKAGNE